MSGLLLPAMIGAFVPTALIYNIISRRPNNYIGGMLLVLQVICLVVMGIIMIGENI